MDDIHTFMCVMLCLHVYCTDEATSPTLYSPTTSAVLGSPFTLVCTWNKTESVPMDISWVQGVDEEYIFNSQTCELEKPGNQSFDKSAVTAKSGYLYQSLTVTQLSSSDIGGNWYCARNSSVSNIVTIRDKEQTGVFLSSEAEIVYTGSSITLTCTFENGPLSSGDWLIQQTVYFSLRKSCTVDLQEEGKSDERDIIHRSQTDCSQNSSQTVTINNITLDDHGVEWQCSIGGKTSNVFTVIVLDSDLPSNVNIYRQTVSEQDENVHILVCSSACENEFIFHWEFNVPGFFSNTDYDSCSHTCSETLTLNVSDNDHGKLIQCTVTNNRTLKSSTAQYEIETDHVESHGLPPYVWGAAGGGASIIVIVIVVVIVVCRRRRSSNPSKVMVDNILYESGPEIGQQESRGSKIVMENILYESGDPNLNVDNKKVSAGDSSYEKFEIKSQNEYYILEQVATADNKSVRGTISQDDVSDSLS